MARIDIDRHILTEIVKNRQDMKKCVDRVLLLLKQIAELNARNDALYKHIISLIEEFDTRKGLETR